MRRALLLLLLLPAVACTAADDRVPPSGAVPTTPTAIPTSPETSNAPVVDATPGWAVRRTDHADLDGAGRPEEIGYGGEYGPIRLTTTLSSDRVVSMQLRRKVQSWWPEGYPDLDGDRDQEIVLAREWSAARRPVIVDLSGDELVWIIPGRHQPLTYGPSAGEEPGTAYANDWFVRRGRLVSYHSLDAFPLSSHLFNVPDEYRVWVWVWSLQGDWLRPLDQGVWCRRESSPYPVPCGTGDLPALLPTVRGTNPVDVFPGELPPTECGPASAVSTIRIPGGPDGTSGWLVVGPGCAESSAYDVYVEVDGRWVAAEHPSRPFLGTGIEETAHGHNTYDAWVTADGGLYSSRGPDGSARRRVWSWTLDGTVLRHEYLGQVCFDPVDRPRLYGTC